MSKIALSGDASGTGTFTIASPSSNSNYTMTLPSANGTVQVSGNPISGTTGTFSGLIFADGGGVQFPATQVASGDANCLDDYEEGTWTPTLVGSSSGSISGGNRIGIYTKVGRLVHARFSIINNNTGISGVSGFWKISLPFPNAQGNGGYWGGCVTYNRNVNRSGDWLSVWSSANDSFVYLMANYMNGTESQAVSGAVPADMLLSGEVVYMTT